MSLAESLPLDVLKDIRHRDAAAARELADFLAWRELGNNSPGTLYELERKCAVLLRSFPEKRFDEFTDGDVAHALMQFTPASRWHAKVLINQWFKWGVLTDRRAGNPVDKIPKITRKKKRDHDIFSEAEAEALCALPSPDGALMELKFWAGLRTAECRLLTGKRVLLDRSMLVVTDGAKGSKERLVPLFDRSVKVLADLMLTEGIGPDDHLWYLRIGRNRKLIRNRTMSHQSFYLWWDRCCDDAKVRRRTPHMARHTYATVLRRRGLPLEDIQDNLGHESIATTKDIYDHGSVEERAERMKALMQL